MSCRQKIGLSLSLPGAAMLCLFMAASAQAQYIASKPDSGLVGAEADQQKKIGGTFVPGSESLGRCKSADRVDAMKEINSKSNRKVTTDGDTKAEKPPAVIGPQGSDATVIEGVNTAGTVKVNNLAMIEALLNIGVNGTWMFCTVWCIVLVVVASYQRKARHIFGAVIPLGIATGAPMLANLLIYSLRQ